MGNSSQIAVCHPFIKEVIIISKYPKMIIGNVKKGYIMVIIQIPKIVYYSSCLIHVRKISFIEDPNDKNYSIAN